MTELSPLALVTPENIAKIGSCGVLLPNTEGKIVDLETGKAVGPNQTGELCVKGPQVRYKYIFQGVWCLSMIFYSCHKYLWNGVSNFR